LGGEAITGNRQREKSGEEGTIGFNNVTGVAKG